MMVVGAVNYVLASVTCFAASYIAGNTRLSSETMFWGSIQGVAFIVTYYLICTTMSLSGMAIATAFVRLSVVLPVLASVFYWGEIPSHFQVIGIVVCLVSLPLIGTRARNVGTSTKMGWRELRLVGMLFVFIGIAGIASKGFIMSCVPDAPTTFMGVLYGVAALGALSTFLFPAWKTHSKGAADGIKMGFMNVSSIFAYLVALDQVSGVIVFSGTGRRRYPGEHNFRLCSMEGTFHSKDACRNGCCGRWSGPGKPEIMGTGGWQIRLGWRWWVVSKFRTPT